MCQIDISKSGTYPESRAMLINGKTVQKFGLRVKGSSFPNEIVCFYLQRLELNACWVAKSPRVSYTTLFENVSSLDSYEKSLFLGFLPSSWRFSL